MHRIMCILQCDYPAQACSCPWQSTVRVAQDMAPEAQRHVYSHLFIFDYTHIAVEIARTVGGKGAPIDQPQNVIHTERKRVNGKEIIYV